MSTVFISYRHTDNPQRQRVRAFGDRLRTCGIEVVLDQFFMDACPGGPNEGWDKWSSDQALQNEYVLIVGTEDWFRCFDKKQKPGTGLGAACEADDIRQRIYEAGGIIDNIRVVLFDDADAEYIPSKLKRYHRFHADRDFANIVRWLGGTTSGIGATVTTTPHTSIPHNLPSLQPFFGRDDELRRIADALDPESRTWGALIDGPGGMGKTSLAVRAAYDAPPDAFEKIVFVSLKTRELDDDGVRDLSGFLISGLAELFNELARELGQPELAKAPEDQRARLILEILRGTRTLLLLDNLESLTKQERDVVFTFVKKLPPGCKAILTSRRRIGSGAEELILEKLGEAAALATLRKLAETNPALAKTSEAERLTLYKETGGKPLLLRWTAGQIGRGSCLTLADAIAYLQSCPEGNDPLEFIFGDLVDDFSDDETRVLCALTYFTLPAKTEHVLELVACTATDANRALRSLVNRSLVVPSEELKTFALVPLVADYLRYKRPDVVADAGDRLQNRAYVLAVENGYKKYDRFPTIETEWPTLAAALPVFVRGPNDRLQNLCRAMDSFLDFTGRWDEHVALMREAEQRALAAGDYLNAGWRAYHSGMTHYQRGQSADVVACAARAEAHWRLAHAGKREQAAAIQLRGIGHELAKDFAAAIDDYHAAVAIDRSLSSESTDVAIALDSLADAEAHRGNLDAAERNHLEALRIAEALADRGLIAMFKGKLARVSSARKDWPAVEQLAREALSTAEAVGDQLLIADHSYFLASALIELQRTSEARPHAERAAEIYDRLGSPGHAAAQRLLAKCER